MVEEGDQIQPELFEELPRMPRKRRRRKLSLPRGLTVTLSYENVIFGVTLLVMSMVVSFTLGIERGRRIGPKGGESEPQNVAPAKLQEETVQVSTSSVHEEAAPVSQEVASVIKEEASPIPNEPEPSPDAQQPTRERISRRVKEGGYAIQLITYTRQDYAEKEIAKLKEGGFTPYIVRTGKYFVVCIGPYESYNKAKSLLKEFKSQASYRSAFLKKLSR